jgi:hypothetical protein
MWRISRTCFATPGVDQLFETANLEESGLSAWEAAALQEEHYGAKNRFMFVDWGRNADRRVGDAKALRS